MDLNDYISSLSDAPEASGYVATDREGELHYMRAHRFHFDRIDARLPAVERPLRLLDIGTTPFTFHVKQRFPHYDVWSLDRSPVLAERSAAHGVQLRVCDLDVEPLPFDDAFFDVVVFTEVLEHVFAPPTDVLGEVARILRPGGRLIISVPNIAALDNRVKLALGFSPLEDADSQMQSHPAHGHGHIHEYTMRELVALLEGCGFVVGRRWFVRPPLSHARTMPGLTRPRRWVRGVYLLAQSLWPSLATELLVECDREAS